MSGISGTTSQSEGSSAQEFLLLIQAVVQLTCGLDPPGMWPRQYDIEDGKEAPVKTIKNVLTQRFEF